MPKLLCLGHAPLPSEESRLRCSGHLRTWQLVKPLLGEGHEVRLVAARVPSEVDGADPAGAKECVEESREGRLHYFSSGLDRFEDPGYLQAHHDEFSPDAVIGINNHPASRAVRLKTEAPIWCDLNGWAMAEAQSKAATYEDDVYLSHFWNMERSILERADGLSTVSEAQKHAVVGELALLGRLGRQNLGYDFCHVVPNAFWGLGDGDAAPARIPGLPPDAFVLLWSGGYNTWADVDLLAEVLDLVMSEHEELFFVSTGGSLPGHDTLTFERFRRQIARRGLGHRTHFTGWIEGHEMPRYYAAADLGLNVDKRCYEATYGARNRINEMVGRGLTVLTTVGTEISRELSDRGLILGADPGDAEGLAQQIRWAVENRQGLRSMATAALGYAAQHYSYAATTSPLLEWAAAPRRAPDGGEAVSLEVGIDFFSSQPPESGVAPARSRHGSSAGWGSPLNSEDLWRDESESAEERCARLEQRLESITRSRFWRVWMLWHTLRRTVSWA